MYNVEISFLAEQDIKEAADWYNTKQKGLGKLFTSKVREKVKLITNDPCKYSKRYKDVRTSVLEVFPYMIHFLIDDSQKEILILAVLHTSRNPDLWNREEGDSR